MPLFLGPKEDSLLARPDDKDLAVPYIGHVEQGPYASRSSIALPMQYCCDRCGSSQPFTGGSRCSNGFLVCALEIADRI